MTFKGKQKSGVDKVITEDQMPAGKHTCNAVRSYSDGYCKLPGVKEFGRCKLHGGATELASDVFRKAMPLEKAEKLQALLNDTLSMDNELAAAKTMLVQELENYNRANYVLNTYLENTPVRPQPHDPDFERDIVSYNIAADLHAIILEKAENMRDKSFKDSQKLIRILSEGIAKNNKIKEGNKFQLDVKQISRLLKVQLEAHQYCKGCPNLKKVVAHIKEHTKDIPLNPNVSKKNKEAVGRRAYSEMIDEVNANMGEVQDADFEVE